MPALRGSIKLSLFCLWCLLGIPLQWLVLQATTGKASLVIPLYWHKVLCALFGLKVETEGEPVRGRQVVIASNHLSYLDIPVFSCFVPWSFVARADVADWPLFGTLARLQQTAFTSRARTDAMKDRDTLSAALRAGRNLIIFPEGTSSDGAAVLPFKSSLLGAALSQPGLAVQPVTLVLLETDGRPVSGPATRDLYAWHGDMTLPPHLWAFAKSRGARLRLVFHPPVDPEQCQDRKRLAAACEASVAAGLRKTISAQGWLPAGNNVRIPTIKESDDEFFDPGSRQASDLHADKVRQ